MQIVSGVSTSGVILSTVRWLADADFNITVIRDCCADRDHDVHTMLCNKVRTLATRVSDWIHTHVQRSFSQRRRPVGMHAGVPTPDDRDGRHSVPYYRPYPPFSIAVE